MKLPVNYADVRMEQLLQHTQTSFGMVKDEESRRTIIELQHSVLGVILDLIKAERALEKSGSKSLKKRIAIQSAGSSNMIASKYYSLNDD